MIKKQKLSEEDYNLLSAFYLTKPYLSVKKYIDVQVHNSAQIALSSVTNMEELSWHRGYAKGLLSLLKEIENASKEVEKIEKRRADEEKKD